MNKFPERILCADDELQQTKWNLMDVPLPKQLDDNQIIVVRIIYNLGQSKIEYWSHTMCVNKQDKDKYFMYSRYNIFGEGAFITTVKPTVHEDLSEPVIMWSLITYNI
jgi:hypothetical protein